MEAASWTLVVKPFRLGLHDSTATADKSLVELQGLGGRSMVLWKTNPCIFPFSKRGRFLTTDIHEYFT